MKPTNWDQMPKSEKLEIAESLFKSTRGSYILGQALHLAAAKLREAKYPEESNAQDMEILSTLFFPFGELEQASAGFGKTSSVKTGTVQRDAPAT